MQRILISGVLLLLFGAASGRRKQEPFVFVFRGIDRERGVAMLRPMIAPDIGVQLDSGARDMKPGAVLRCVTSEREHQAIVEGQPAKIVDVVLDCGEDKFVVRELISRQVASDSGCSRDARYAGKRGTKTRAGGWKKSFWRAELSRGVGMEPPRVDWRQI